MTLDPTTLPPYRIQPLAYPRRVFCNRALRMESIGAVGFDMDYTLARYQPEMEIEATRLSLERLMDLHYPRSAVALRYDPEFAIRGLVIDTQHGNVVKMDAHKHVTRAWHGHQRIPQEARRALYQSEPLRLSESRWAMVDTLFALPEVFLFAHLVELLDLEHGEPLPAERYRQLYTDIRASVDLVHRDDSLKRQVRADPARFLDRDPDLPMTLHRLRSSGKKLFIVTNSDWSYTDAVMGHLLGGSMREYGQWQDFFDVVLCAATKPRFFDNPADPVAVPGQKRCYEGGGLQSLEKILGVSGDAVLYVGDHIYGDVLRSKKSSVWRTALIVPEMEPELGALERLAPALEQRALLEGRRFELEMRLGTAELHLQMVRRAERRLEAEARGERLPPPVTDRQLFRSVPPGWGIDQVRTEREATRAEIAELRRLVEANATEGRGVAAQIEPAFSGRFGMLFKEGHEHSVFGEQVETYACIYTSRVSNLGAYPPNQYFRAPRDVLPHERFIPDGHVPFGSSGADA